MNNIIISARNLRSSDFMRILKNVIDTRKEVHNDNILLEKFLVADLNRKYPTSDFTLHRVRVHNEYEYKIMCVFHARKEFNKFKLVESIL